jgi:hypothetical protein
MLFAHLAGMNLDERPVGLERFAAFKLNAPCCSDTIYDVLHLDACPERPRFKEGPSIVKSMQCVRFQK